MKNFSTLLLLSCLTPGCSTDTTPTAEDGQAAAVPTSAAPTSTAPTNSVPTTTPPTTTPPEPNPLSGVGADSDAGTNTAADAGAPAETGLRIYYIRHAQAGHNIVDDWEDVPEDEWPEYVGNPNMFTPLGEEQLATVPGKLQDIEFDFIAASPLWRARNTILPYMKAAGSKGEIWPELKEISTRSLILDSDLPEVTVPILGEGSLIDLPSDETDWFSLRPDGLYNFDKPDTETDEEATAAAKVILLALIELIQDRFGGTDKTILLAGHGSAGRALLRLLTNSLWDEDPRLPGIENAGVWMLEEQADGTFQLKMFNDALIETYSSDAG